MDLGAERQVTAEVHLGSLTTEDVAVELLHGPVAGGNELTTTDVVRLSLSGGGTGGTVRYQGSFTCDHAGRHGYTVRVVPAHADLVRPGRDGLRHLGVNA